MAKRDYLVEAAKQIRMALDSEVNEDYEAAFSYYKNGVDLLLNGVQCKWATLGFSLRLCDIVNGEFEEACLDKACDGIMWPVKTGSHKPKFNHRFSCWADIFPLHCQEVALCVYSPYPR